MSVQLIQQYHTRVEKIIRYGGSRNEGSQRNLEVIAELDYRTRYGSTIYPDGTLKDALHQDWGLGRVNVYLLSYIHIIDMENV